LARGTDFGGIHSLRDLNLIQQAVEISPAEPKLNLIDVPGADGSKDMSEQPSGRVVYKDRKITWTFALYPGEDWSAKHRQVSNALNGVRCRITLDEDPEYYYTGRLVVNRYNRDKTLRQITVHATCAPYMLKQQPTKVQLAGLTTAYKTLTLVNERMPVVPTITVTAATTLRWNGNTWSLNAGTHKVLDIELQAGKNTLEAKTNSGTGNITVEYQEGAL
jgi:hypothetical protein